MPRLIQHTLLSVRDLLASVGPFVLLAVLLLWLAYELLDPTPPRRVVLATGPDQGAYQQFGERYAAELKKHGIEVVLRATQGAGENLRLLRDPAQQVDLAFAQGGAGDAIYAVDEDRSGEALVSLGSLFYEPVWVFYRRAALRDGAPLAQVAQLAPLRLELGAPHSGSRNLLAKLLHANGMAIDALAAGTLAPSYAVAALLNSEADVVVLVSAPESPLVRMLLITPGIGLMEFPQAQAYARQFGFLTALNLPRGIADLKQDLPPRDLALIAATSSLVARADTHPALIQLFVQAARRIHGGTGWFARSDEFPKAEGGEAPLADEAARFYRSGPPLLQRHLPFWLANLIDRMWLALVSIIAVLIPLSRVVPPLYEFRIRSRVFRWYGQLREIEAALGEPDADVTPLRTRLDDLDARVGRISVPLSYADELYALRSHIELVRARLGERRGEKP
jgi:NMT1-like family